MQVFLCFCPFHGKQTMLTILSHTRIYTAVFLINGRRYFISFIQHKPCNGQYIPKIVIYVLKRANKYFIANNFSLKSTNNIFVYREGDHSEAAHEKRLLCAQKCTRGGVGWVM